MRRTLLISGLLALLLTGPVLAHGGYRHHHHHGHRASIGVVVGAPLYWGWGYAPRPYYPAPYYYPPYPAPVVVSPPAPVTYIERGDTATAPTRDYWYYCPESQAYYPYVKHCAKGWQRVNPQPAD